jgi:TonB family protein
MRYIIFLLFSFSLAIQSIAQDTTIIVISCGDDNISEIPEIDPMFPGGMDSMMTFIAKNFVMSGTCVCGSWTTYEGFIVNTDGSLCDIKILKGSDMLILDNEALRVVQSMPNWIPAQDDGKVVRSRFVVPISVTIK